MNLKIFILLISYCFGFLVQAQQSSKDSVSIDEKQFFVGVDLLNPIASFFSSKKNYNGFVSYKFKNRWIAVAEVGYEKNIYKENDWNVDAKGIYLEVGVNYILTNYYEKTGQGFYIGGRLAFTPYEQTIINYPIKEMNTSNQVQTIGNSSLPKANVSAGWLEAVLGAKVQLGESPLYLDFIIKPKFLVYSKKQDHVDNLVIPGFGKNKGDVNISFLWGISYRIF